MEPLHFFVIVGFLLLILSVLIGYVVYLSYQIYSSDPSKYVRIFSIATIFEIIFEAIRRI
jgi:hypothetical protein